jgi:hypothetical protein
MRNVNQKRKYSNWKQFNECCYTAQHDAADIFKEQLGVTLKTGGEWEFIKYNPQEKIDKHTTRMVKYSNRNRNRNRKEKAIGSNLQTDSKRQLGQTDSG